MTARYLAEFGRWCFFAGWIGGAFFFGQAERHDWPWWLVFIVGMGGFQLMYFVIGRLAERAVAKTRESS